MEKLDFLAIGTPLMDLFFRADYGFLKKHGLRAGCTNHLGGGELAEIERELKPVHAAAGDNARNVCEAYVACGGANCAYAGNVADDAAGREIRANLKEKGILDLTENLDGKTGKAICIITPDKQRTFAVHLGVGEKKVAVRGVDAPKMFFCTSITLFLEGAGESAFWHARRFRKEGSKIAISLESENLLEKNLGKLPEICGMADYLFLNGDEMAAAGKNLENAGGLAPVVFLKLGERGARVYKGGKLLGEAAALKVEKVEDTTGAGDFFAGAVLRALAAGKSEMEAAKDGNSTAADVISKLGAAL